MLLVAVFGARAATIYPLLAATTRLARENTQYTDILIGGIVASLPPSVSSGEYSGMNILALNQYLHIKTGLL